MKNEMKNKIEYQKPCAQIIKLGTAGNLNDMVLTSGGEDNEWSPWVDL